MALSLSDHFQNGLGLLGDENIMMPVENVNNYPCIVNCLSTCLQSGTFCLSYASSSSSFLSFLPSLASCKGLSPTPHVLKISESYSFPPDVYSIKSNSNGTAVMLICERDIYVVVLHPSYYRGATYEEECKIIHLNVNNKESVKIICAEFHVLNQNSIVCITEDSMLYSYVYEDPFSHSPSSSFFQDGVYTESYLLKTKETPVGISFGAKRGWESTSLFVLSNDGGVDVICPFVPHLSVIEEVIIHEMKKEMESFDEDTYAQASLWLSTGWSSTSSLQGRGKGVFRSNVWYFDSLKIDYNISFKMVESINVIAAEKGGKALCLKNINYLTGIEHPLIIRVFDNGRVDCIAMLASVEPKWMSKRGEKHSSQIVPTDLLDSFLIPNFKTNTSTCNKAQILPDPRFPDFFYIVHPNFAVAVKLTWVSQLKLYLENKGELSPSTCLPIQVPNKPIIGFTVISEPLLGHFFVVRGADQVVVHGADRISGFTIVDVPSKMSNEKFESKATPISKTVLSLTESTSSLSFASTTTNITSSSISSMSQIEFAIIIAPLLKDIKDFQLKNKKSYNITNEIEMNECLSSTISHLEPLIMNLSRLREECNRRVALLDRLVGDQKDLQKKVEKDLTDTENTFNKTCEKLDSALKRQEELSMKAVSLLHKLENGSKKCSKAEKLYHDELKALEKNSNRLKAKVDQALHLEKRLVNSSETPQSMTSQVKEYCFEMLSGTREILSESQNKIRDMENKIKPLKKY